MLKHTPGPWTELTGTISGPNGDEIAEVVGGDGGRYLDDDVNAECAANSRLIAAAPEILELLYLALPYVEEGEQFNHPRKKSLSRDIRNILASLGDETADK